MIRRADYDRVKVIGLEQGSIVFGFSRCAANLSGREIQIGLVQVAKGNYVGIGMFKEGIEHLIASISQANKTEPHALIRSEDTKAAEGRAAAGNSYGFGELSASPIFHDQVKAE